MKKIFTEPLIHFLILGLGLFFIVNNFAPEKLIATNTYSIVINDKILSAYLQYQRKSFDPSVTDAMIDAMSAVEKRQLRNNYMRDEALFREAIKLNLNDNDEIIRRRLIQKMEYLSQGFYADIPVISEQKLEAYFNEHKATYKIDTAISFTHIFVKQIASETAPAKTKAIALLSKANQRKVLFEDASQYGDRFLFNQNYLERTPVYIANHFGHTFAEAIFKLEAGDVWQGPIHSQYGYHIVLIKDKTVSRIPTLTEVAGIVLADAQRYQKNTLKQAAIDALLAKYHVVLQ